MCKVHDKVNGSNAVELFAEARLLDNVCKARYNYLMSQAKSFHAWLDSQEWCEDADKFCQAIVAHVEKALDPDSDKCADYLFEDNATGEIYMQCAGLRLFQEYEDYHKEMEMIANRGYTKAFSKPEKLKEMEARLENYKVELKLHDQIQDFIDALPKYEKVGQYKAVFKRLDARKNEGKLSYSGWVIFSNQLMEKMGKPGIKSKYEIKSLADQIVGLEAKIADLNTEIMEAPEYFRDEHPEADEFIKING